MIDKIDYHTHLPFRLSLSNIKKQVLYVSTSEAAQIRENNSYNCV